jgi:hypothetical protein
MSDSLVALLMRLNLDTLASIQRAGLGNMSEPVFDQLRALALIHEEKQRIRDLLIALAGGPQSAEFNPSRDSGSEFEHAGSAASEPARPDAELSDEARALLEQLEQARAFMLRHPIASQAVFSALIAEGRRYSTTESGAVWAEGLAGSPAMTRGRELWEATSLNLLVDDEQTVLPSTWVEALLRTVELPELEQLLDRLHTGGAA